MKVEFTHKFIKIFRKRFFHQIKLSKKFDERTILFSSDQSNPILKDHALAGNLKGFRSFSITGDIRVIYYIKGNIAYFVDIGSHNQVYGE